ncbi:hypothetical protein RND81_12G027600 [Saponaria officinalis]|uniref:Uncharacterized protein n=1 Tax=Saponaria officinalis TaxID=3572 RepID=A0AAW1H6D7_SAPOF
MAIQVMEAQTIKVTIPVYPLLQKIIVLLEFPEPEFRFLDENKNNAYVSVKADAENLSYVYTGGEAETIADSCEKASHRAVLDLMKKFGVSVEDITYARNYKIQECAYLYCLKRIELEKIERGKSNVCESKEELYPNVKPCKTVTVDYMPILRQIFRKVQVKSTPIETVEKIRGKFISWLTLTPSTRIAQAECIFSEDRLSLVEARESLAKKVIQYLVPLYNLEIVDANYDVKKQKHSEVISALVRESYLTVKERVLRIKEGVEPSALVIEEDCLTPKALAYQIPNANSPPLPSKKRYSRDYKKGETSTRNDEGMSSKLFDVLAEIETVFKRSKKN